VLLPGTGAFGALYRFFVTAHDRRGIQPPVWCKPANEVITDFGAQAEEP